ncbi:MAG: bifunctional phosphopantothenoylcysteine decarboxylase/phosphopantothenate--cysteine ligase CoaBC [Bdellovibrionales bacterium]|nr:bifunctional phosphopantothenoylcysteine decarboxylase/phosphopantothenate--cysteine ligase CoaBC [Bdellovibrionales bacterium]
MSKSKVLFMMTGSIACYKACQVISRLVQAGNEVQVVASPGALQFVGNATFEGLTGKSVVSDLYAPGSVMDHIHLMRWADLVVVAPATANYINKIAQGVGDDLLTTLFLAHDFKKPFLLAPAMNTSMYMHPVTQSSIKRLREMGIEILETASGVLACGETGFGRLLEPDLMLEEIRQHLPTGIATSAAQNEASGSLSIPKSDLVPFRVLVTSGGTVEPIDNVRVITNVSSGETGAHLSELLTDLGCSVHLLRAETAKLADSRVEQSTYSTFHSLQKNLKFLLANREFDAVIHTAAVSDFSVASLEINGREMSAGEFPKIHSSDKLTIHLKNNPKIVDEIKSYSRNKNVKLVAFKLTSKASEEERDQAVAKLREHSKADLVVQNDTSEIDKIKQQHRFTLYSGADKKVPLENIQALASELLQNFMKEKL